MKVLSKTTRKNHFRAEVAEVDTPFTHGIVLIYYS
jgi:hypothetical protein